MISPALIAAPLPGLLALGHHNLLAELGLQLTQLAQDGVKLVVLTNIFCNYSNIFGTIKYFHLTVLEVDEGAAILRLVHLGVPGLPPQHRAVPILLLLLVQTLW